MTLRSASAYVLILLLKLPEPENDEIAVAESPKFRLPVPMKDFKNEALVKVCVVVSEAVKVGDVIDLPAARVIF